VRECRLDLFFRREFAAPDLRQSFVDVRGSIAFNGGRRPGFR
jgi:hypothetical protein